MKDVVSGLVGTSFFAIPFVALSMPMLPSLIIGGSAFVASELLLTKKEEIKYERVPIEKKIEIAKLQNKHILDMEKMIEDDEVRLTVKEIYLTVNRIIKTIEENNSKEKVLKNFFEYYLPLAEKIIYRYDLIENEKLTSSESEKFMKSTNDMIKEINVSFKKILNELYIKEMVDTDIEMKVFNSLLKQDGYNNDINIDKE